MLPVGAISCYLQFVTVSAGRAEPRLPSMHCHNWSDPQHSRLTVSLISAHSVWWCRQLNVRECSVATCKRPQLRVAVERSTGTRCCPWCSSVGLTWIPLWTGHLLPASPAASQRPANRHSGPDRRKSKHFNVMKTIQNGELIQEP